MRFKYEDKIREGYEIPYMITTMNSSNQNLKRSALCDITNNPNDRQDPEKDGQKYGIFDEQQWFPIQPNAVDESRHITPVHFATQNVHPYLARYQHELKTDFLSHSDISRILAPDNELEMLHLLQETGVIANFQQCKYCGGGMHFQKLSNTWYWICTRRYEGVKCNRGKISVRKGTFFDNSRLPIATVVWIVWHFLHHLSEEQCKQYTNIGEKNRNMLVKYYLCQMSRSMWGLDLGKQTKAWWIW